MVNILGLASASAAVTTVLSLLAGLDPAPAALAGPPPQVPAVAAAVLATDAAPVRAIRVIPIDGRFGPADRPSPR
jgi:hypothetical protein